VKRRAFLGAVAAAAVVPRPARAQAAYPSRPVKLIVPFAAGGNTDLLARLVAERMAEALKQPVLVDNRPGASATIGTDAVAKSAPDGYTLIMSNNLGIATAPLVYGNVTYRPLEDFAHLFLIGSFANAFAVRADHPAKSMAEFLALARAQPGRLTYGSAGPGSAGHLTGELLKQRAGIDLVHVPYKGSGPAVADLLAGQIDAMFDGMPTATQLVRGGRVRLLAVSSERRVPTFPDVPTLDELVPGAIGVAWFGVSAPAKTPREAQERLEREGVRVVTSAEMQAKLGELGMFPGGMAGAEYTRFVASEIRKWTPIVRATGVKAE
jgi:tripartite-type tricarboxylate transporter receptor subunit TctC